MIKNWFKDESGQALSEYGLLIAVLAVAIIGALVAFRGQLTSAFNKLGNEIGAQ